VLQHHPHGALTHFGGKLRGCPVIRHGSSLSRVGASDKPGAVQIDVPIDISLDILHEIIQAVMPWGNYHGYGFHVRDTH